MERGRLLQMVGAINAMCALLAERAGFGGIYLSGAAVANASHGLPDLGLTELKHVLEDTRRVVAVTSVPLLVDADTSWGDHEMTSEAASRLSEVGAAGLHLEDQIDTKRCGHRPGKRLVSTVQMQRRIETAVKARIDQEFVIMARTDAVMVEGLDATINRARDYLEAGPR